MCRAVSVDSCDSDGPSKGRLPRSVRSSGMRRGDSERIDQSGLGHYRGCCTPIIVYRCSPSRCAIIPTHCSYNAEITKRVHLTCFIVYKFSNHAEIKAGRESIPELAKECRETRGRGSGSGCVDCSSDVGCMVAMLNEMTAALIQMVVFLCFRLSRRRCLCDRRARSECSEGVAAAAVPSV